MSAVRNASGSPPNPAFQPTPLSGPKIGHILQCNFVLPVYRTLARRRG